MRANNHQLNLAGKYAVLSHLNLLGLKPTFTRTGNSVRQVEVNGVRLRIRSSRNTAYDTKLFGHTLDWLMTEDHETPVHDMYYCFVNFSKEKEPRFFILPSIVVAEYISTQHQLWLERAYRQSLDDINLRTFRIGLDKSQGKYAIETPLAVEFENRWDLLQIKVKETV